MFDPQILLVATVVLPGCAFALMATAWLAGLHLPEKATTRLAGATYCLAGLSLAGLIAALISRGVSSLRAEGGSLYAVDKFEIPLVLFVDHLSLPLVSLTVLLVGLIALFSKRYLHRDPHFNRFFLLLHLFAFGALLLFTAGSFDLLIGGWELVGITSVLLIAFFQERSEPVLSSIRVFVTYRACDIGLITGAFALHHVAGTTSYDALFNGAWPSQNMAMGGGASVVGLLFLFAAMGKSAQAPFSGWLPRAMEGPTPSSAIFYGAISIHAGAYLLLRAQPILEASPIATAGVIAIGAWSAIHGTLVARVCADAKTSLAYSSISQLGLIFVEIGMGWSWLALSHIIGHALVRTLQLLKAPSLLHDFHNVHAAAGGHLAKTGALYDSLLPPAVRSWLYRLALDRGHHDTVLDRFVAGGLKRFGVRMTAFEERWNASGEKRAKRESAWLS